MRLIIKYMYEILHLKSCLATIECGLYLSAAYIRVQLTSSAPYIECTLHWVRLTIECGLQLSAAYNWVRLPFECSLHLSSPSIWVRPILKSSSQSAAYNHENTVWIVSKLRISHEHFSFYWLKSNWYWSKSNEKTKCEKNVFDTNAISW